MENGVFVTLAEFLLTIPGMSLVMGVVGIPGVFVVFLLMPFRIIWVMSIWVKPGDKVIADKVSYMASNAFLMLAIYSAVEPVVVMANAGPGSASGIMLVFFSFIPLIFYLFFEWYRYEAYRHIANNESDKVPWADGEQ